MINPCWKSSGHLCGAGVPTCWAARWRTVAQGLSGPCDSRRAARPIAWSHHDARQKVSVLVSWRWWAFVVSFIKPKKKKKKTHSKLLGDFKHFNSCISRMAKEGITLTDSPSKWDGPKSDQNRMTSKLLVASLWPNKNKHDKSEAVWVSLDFRSDIADFDLSSLTKVAEASLGDRLMELEDRKKKEGPFLCRRNSHHTKRILSYRYCL